MPRLIELKPQYKKREIGKMIEGYRKMRDMKQVELATACNMSQQNYSRKVKSNQFKYIDLLRIFKALELTDTEILELMKV